MHADYKSLVLLKYKNGCAAQTLSLLLINPTPKNLRSACAELCNTRFDKGDQQILAMFFGLHESKKVYADTISNLPAEKFKSLQYFLLGKTEDPEDKIVELTAWLVDVKPRPFQRGFNYEKVDSYAEPAIDENPITVSNEKLNQQVSTQPIRLGLFGNVDKRSDIATQPLRLNTHRNIIVLVIALLTVTIIGFWMVGTTGSGCMYWAGDHYEQVACDNKEASTMIIAADKHRLRDFKKITRIDTITIKALGHVWYSKINNEIEYFTADGFHPVQVNYHLKPLTLYMIQQHIHQ